MERRRMPILAAQAGHIRHQAKGRFGKHGFRYVPADDVSICPAAGGYDLARTGGLGVASA
jgi:hypothetical protein